MKRVFLVSAISLATGLTSANQPHAARKPDTWMQVASEISWRKSQAAPAPRWRSANVKRSAVAILAFRDLPASRVRELHQRNQRDLAKRTQVGIARVARVEAASGFPALQWTATADGGATARIEIESPRALALRVGLQLQALPAGTELRFAGSDDPSRVTALVGRDEALRLADSSRVYWTPTTEGSTQIIEVYVPKMTAAQTVRLQAPSVSHFLTSSKKDFVLKDIGDSGSCNVNTTCRVNELGANFVKAKDSVARMVFVEGSSSYICTGTLLADTVGGSQIPYFYSADHCISNQTVASTLETYWKFEAATCSGGVAANNIQLLGGATYLYSSNAEAGGTDALLLRLNQAPPAGSHFSGWDSSPLTTSVNVTAIHHPKGDLKKVSLGQRVSSSATEVEVGWTSGTTEGGSSGSGLFTSTANGYFLRGGLYGGSASCTNTGSTSNPDNRDYYSRFDVAFPHIQRYLAPPAVARPTHDFDGDGRSDLLWRHVGHGKNAVWRYAQNTSQLAISAVTNQAWKIAGAGDFDGDAKADVFWRNTSTGANTIWLSANSATQRAVTGVPSQAWTVVGMGDFNRDGKTDAFWRNVSSGANTIWLSGNASTQLAVSAVTNFAWQVAAIGDFNGDGQADVLWRSGSTGANEIWRSGNSSQKQAMTAVTNIAWKIVGSGDFNGDGKADVLWRNADTGANTIWLSASNATQQSVNTVGDQGWKIGAIGDYNGDGRSDVLWRHAISGNNALWHSGNAATALALTRVDDKNWKLTP